ncbi:MAG: 16S rRNA (guanine(527)-N(7))-methyltransferase RsmG [Phycisphaeraceae bacterium]
MPTIPDFVRTALTQLDLRLDDEAMSLLARYLDLLLETNKQFNLTAIKDVDTAWRRHVIDSLTLLPGLEHLAAAARVIDVGSGGGLPGIPLAIARPELAVTLLEATGKKARFLERCVADLPLPNTHVVCGRAEEVGHDRAHRQRYDVVVCRAVGPMNEVLEYTLPLAAMGGKVMIMKGVRIEQEMDAAGDALAMLGAGDLQLIPAYPDGFAAGDPAAVIVSIVKEYATPREYPRRPGIPHQAPL